jgi:hypothetical protein
MDEYKVIPGPIYPESKNKSIEFIASFECGKNQYDVALYHGDVNNGPTWIIRTGRGIDYRSGLLLPLLENIRNNEVLTQPFQLLLLALALRNAKHTIVHSDGWEDSLHDKYKKKVATKKSFWLMQFPGPWEQR